MSVRSAILDWGLTRRLSDQGHRALCHAIKQGFVAVVDFLLEHARVQGADDLYEALLKQPCTCEEGPLILRAIINGQLPLVEYATEKQGKQILFQSLPFENGADIFPHMFAAHGI